MNWVLGRLLKHFSLNEKVFGARSDLICTVPILEVKTQLACLELGSKFLIDLKTTCVKEKQLNKCALGKWSKENKENVSTSILQL